MAVALLILKSSKAGSQRSIWEPGRTHQSSKISLSWKSWEYSFRRSAMSKHFSVQLHLNTFGYVHWTRKKYRKRQRSFSGVFGRGRKTKMQPCEDIVGIFYNSIKYCHEHSDRCYHSDRRKRKNRWEQPDRNIERVCPAFSVDDVVVDPIQRLAPTVPYKACFIYLVSEVKQVLGEEGESQPAAYELPQVPVLTWFSWTPRPTPLLNSHTAGICLIQDIFWYAMSYARVHVLYTVGRCIEVWKNIYDDLFGRVKKFFFFFFFFLLQRKWH